MLYKKDIPLHNRVSFSLMNLLACSKIMLIPKPCGDTSIFQFYFSIITNCQSPRLLLSSKSILILISYIYKLVFFPLHLFSVDHASYFPCNSLYSNFPGLKSVCPSAALFCVCVWLVGNQRLTFQRRKSWSHN
jgi:hypothetical protein